MGGSGSGCRYQWWRAAKKTTVEECRSLDASRWMREGILKSGVRQHGSWSWYRDEERISAIGYEVDTTGELPWLRLTYTFTEQQDSLDYRIRLVTTRPRFGGLRWWFVCPLMDGGLPCGRRVGKLYLPPSGRYYGCRHCYDLTYTSCQESRKYDTAFRFMAQDTGYDFATVKRLIGRIGKRDW